MARRVKRAAEPVEQPILEVRPGTFQVGDLFSDFGRDDKPGWLRRRWRYAQTSEHHRMEMASHIELPGPIDAHVLEWLYQHHPDQRTDTLPIVFQLGDMVSDLAAQVGGDLTCHDMFESFQRLFHVELSVEIEVEYLALRHTMKYMDRLLVNIVTVSEEGSDETYTCSLRLSDIALTLVRTGQLWTLEDERQLLEQWQVTLPHSP